MFPNHLSFVPMQTKPTFHWFLVTLFLALATATHAAEPSILVTSPPPDANVRTLTFITVVFSEGVTNVDASDLLINNVGATNLLRVSTVEYQFKFPEPPVGNVAVAWAAGHGITDLSGSPVPFAGGNWSYTLDPNGRHSPASVLRLRTTLVEHGTLPLWPAHAASALPLF